VADDGCVSLSLPPALSLFLFFTSLRLSYIPDCQCENSRAQVVSQLVEQAAVNMRAHKIFFLIFLAVYFIAGLSLLITGSVAHRHAKQYAEITGYSLVSGAGFIIGLGVIIIVLCGLGFIGAYKNRLGLLQAFIASLFLILILQLIAAIVAFTLRNKAEDQLKKNLYDTLPKYVAGNGAIVTEWDRLQRTWSCCGVEKFDDWTSKTTRKTPPYSCCVEGGECSGNDNGTYFKDGCYGAARALFFRYSAALGGVSLFFFFVEIVGLILAILLLRDLKNNYGSV